MKQQHQIISSHVGAFARQQKYAVLRRRSELHVKMDPFVSPSEGGKGDPTSSEEFRHRRLRSGCNKKNKS